MLKSASRTICGVGRIPSWTTTVSFRPRSEPATIRIWVFSVTAIPLIDTTDAAHGHASHTASSPDSRVVPLTHVTRSGPNAGSLQAEFPARAAPLLAPGVTAGAGGFIRPFPDSGPGL